MPDISLQETPTPVKSTAYRPLEPPAMTLPGLAPVLGRYAPQRSCEAVNGDE
jgi:hypothetical protein